jgi:hypothetical protein
MGLALFFCAATLAEEVVRAHGTLEMKQMINAVGGQIWLQRDVLPLDDFFYVWRNTVYVQAGRMKASVLSWVPKAKALYEEERARRQLLGDKEKALGNGRAANQGQQQGRQGQQGMLQAGEGVAVVERMVQTGNNGMKRKGVQNVNTFHGVKKSAGGSGRT